MAGLLVLARESTRAWIHRRNEEKASGEGGRARRASDRDAAFLDRLPQHFEHSPVELGHLVEEQHAAVRERDLAGSWHGTTADESDVGNRVVRRPERPF